MIKLTREKILLLHKLITESSGNNPSIRDIGSLNRALESAFSTSEGKDVYPTKEEKAAVMCYGIISSKPFIEGNKRLGMCVLLTFMEINGVKLRPTNEEIVRVASAVESADMNCKDLLSWILENKY